MQGPLVFHVAYVFMVRRILDFLRVKNDGHSRICYCNFINWIPVLTDYASGVHVEVR
jgi:hypothetical protein